nr:lanthionine synthetase LanC family protein [uncultured Bacteroides sp.]
MKRSQLTSIKKYYDILSLREIDKSTHYGLVEGEVGLMLCNAYLYEVLEDEKYFIHCPVLLEQLLEKHSNNNHTLGYGLTGMTWGISILKDNDMLADNCDIWLENVDNFSGAVDILNYSLQKITINSFVIDMADTLLKKIAELPVEYFFSARKETDPKGQILNIQNLDVPHGITGIILQLLKLEEKIHFGLEPLLYRFLDRLWDLRNTEVQGFMFYSLLGDTKRGSTLAWCYGDLPILHLPTQIVKMKN